MKRDDQHDFLRRGEVGEQAMARNRMASLVNIPYTGGDPYKTFPTYARMAALRDGILCGLMLANVQDDDGHHESHVKVLTGSMNALTKIAAAGASAALPVGGGPASAGIQAAGDLGLLGVNTAVGHRWEKGPLQTLYVNASR